MGYGEITGGGPGGRYEIKLDYGEATRDATVTALNQKAAKMDADIAAAYARLQTAEAEAAVARAQIADATTAYIAQGGSTNSSNLATQAALAFLEMQRLAAVQAEGLTAGVRLQYNAIKLARAQITDMINRWQSAVLIETKSVWCTDLTESGTGFAATIDINGETDLTLLAPGCRAWRGGDGTVSLATRETAIARITARQARIAGQLADLTAKIAAETTKESALKVALDQAHEAYRVASADTKNDAGKAVTAAAEAYQEQLPIVRLLKARNVSAQSLEVQEAQKLARWQARPASEEPNYGDGVMQASAIMSPEQSFFNLAILPGWQRHMPTYRRGEIMALDKDKDLATVELAEATSIAQKLPLNEKSSLSNVPVVYMNCNARAFEVGDNVVVQFLSQDWAKPRVIGFVTDPKPCLLYKARYRAIGNGVYSQGNLHLLSTLERYKDEDWGAFSAPVPSGGYRFIQWSDGVTTLLRNDGKATEDIARRAEYTYAPDFQFYYSWFIDAEPLGPPYWVGQSFRRDWRILLTEEREWKAAGTFGPRAHTPPSGTADVVVWTGVALGNLGPSDVMQAVISGDANSASPPGPIFFPNYPGSSASTLTFKFSGSENIYTVNGQPQNNPYPFATIPDTGGGFETINFTATSWSATYA